MATSPFRASARVRKPFPPLVRLSRFAAPSRQDRLARKSRHGLTAAAPTTPPEPPRAGDFAAALAGDPVALRLWLDRITLPQRSTRGVRAAAHQSSSAFRAETHLRPSFGEQARGGARCSVEPPQP